MSRGGMKASWQALGLTLALGPLLLVLLQRHWTTT